MARLKAQLVLCNVPSVDTGAATRFYGALLGQDFARGLNDDVTSYFQPIHKDGIDMTVTERFDDRERMTCYFAVEDLEGTIRELEGLGGTVEAEPRPVNLSKRARKYREQAKRAGLEVQDTVGTMAVLLDPDKNHVGLIQLEEHAKKLHFKVTEDNEQVTEEQVQELEEVRREAAES
jgi:predicted enzyme related to lactoylglutathione lyase